MLHRYSVRDDEKSAEGVGVHKSQKINKMNEQRRDGWICGRFDAMRLHRCRSGNISSVKDR